MKYISVNSLDDFEFLDSEMSFVSYDNRCLKVNALCLNVHDYSDQNPYNSDMEIDSALISFEGFSVISYEPAREMKPDGNGNYYTDEPENLLYGNDGLERFLIQLKRGVTIITFDSNKDGSYFFDAISADPYFYVCFTFDKIVIEWDDFKKEAWYVSKE